MTVYVVSFENERDGTSGPEAVFSARALAETFVAREQTGARSAYCSWHIAEFAVNEALNGG